MMLRKWSSLGAWAKASILIMRPVDFTVGSALYRVEFQKEYYKLLEKRAIFGRCLGTLKVKLIGAVKYLANLMIFPKSSFNILLFLLK